MGDTTTPTRPTVTALVAGELRALAARRSVSQAAIADQLGVSEMWVSRRMRGDVALTVDELIRITQALGAEPLPVLELALDESP